MSHVIMFKEVDVSEFCLPEVVGLVGASLLVEARGELVVFCSISIVFAYCVV